MNLNDCEDKITELESRVAELSAENALIRSQCAIQLIQIDELLRQISEQKSAQHISSNQQ